MAKLAIKGGISPHIKKPTYASKSALLVIDILNDKADLRQTTLKQRNSALYKKNKVR